MAEIVETERQHIRPLVLLANANRDRIRAFVAKNEGATVREIMKACKISSTSVVAHHLRALQYDGVDVKELRAENELLRRRVKELEVKLARVTAALNK